jgi:hypothetical protein
MAYSYGGLDYAQSLADSGPYWVSQGISLLICLTILVLKIVASWKIYEKADRPGYASVIPFYSQYVLYDIAMGNGWLFILGFIPIVGWIMKLYMCHRLATSFGKGVGYTLGLIFFNPIFRCILAFGEANYIGPQ